MSTLWKHYHTPKTIDETLKLLTDYGGQARIIAGGTDLLVDMRAAQQPAHEALIDITSIPEMGTIQRKEEHIYIGAGVTHTQIVHSAEIQTHARCLVESCGVVGGPQVRNVATLGGNVAHALPAGDGTVSLVALNAEAEVIQAGARRWLPIGELYLGPGKSLLDSTRDLLIQFRLRATGAQEATAFSRIMRPQGVALPILGCAVWVRLDDTMAHYESARVCVAPTGPTPERAKEIEQALAGKPATAETIQQVIQVATDALHPRTSKYRATAEYRKEMIGVLLERTLTAAVERAKGR
ncbi:MAG: FAD binding domain-containing protein [Anaerolineae bacterium]|nr:FAD binding domain-containing protein [Anaerolineae bacterium]MCA9909679.1 FAD binding domain-containing protein [Anaerolineae bacterium]